MVIINVVVRFLLIDFKVKSEWRRTSMRIKRDCLNNKKHIFCLNLASCLHLLVPHFFYDDQLVSSITKRIHSVYRLTCLLFSCMPPVNNGLIDSRSIAVFNGLLCTVKH